MHDAVKRYSPGALETEVVNTNLARRFLTLFCDYPVLRLRIQPGEAYIAPTENVVHDGSSMEMSVADISLSLRGRLGPAVGELL
jgi:hypothetical protein